MPKWNSEQYLIFKEQRTIPSKDLAAKLKRYTEKPENIADAGCGPGNSTRVLKDFFPESNILGIDISENMLKKAEKDNPDLKFSLCDIHSLKKGWDVIFSNACFQWIDHHEKLIPEIMEKLNEGGYLAVQMPMNEEEALFKIIKETAAKWNLKKAASSVNKTLTPEGYFDVLSKCSKNFEIWETVYYHKMPGHESLLEWVRGSRLRPYLEELTEEKGTEFQNEILEKVKKAYPVYEDGSVLLKFRRFFFTAQK